MLPLTAFNAYSVSSSVVSYSLDCSQAPLSMEFSGQEYWSGLPFLNEKAHSFVVWSLLIFPDSSCTRHSCSQHLASCCCCCSSVTKLCLTLCEPMGRSTPGFPVLHHLPEFIQTHVHWVSDAIQPSHSLLSPSLPAFNLSQHQGLFQWVSSSHQVAKVLELQCQFLQWIFRVNLL